MTRPDVSALPAYVATATAFTLPFAAGALAASALLTLPNNLPTQRPDYLAVPTGVTVAILAFATALAVGLRLTVDGSAPPLLWPASTVQVAILLAGVALAGASFGAHLLVIALAAATLALQAAGAHRLKPAYRDTEPIPALALPTAARHHTGLTGVTHPDGHLWARIGSVPALLGGAVLGVAVISATPSSSSLISALAVIAAVTLVRRVDLHRR